MAEIPDVHGALHTEQRSWRSYVLPAILLGNALLWAAIAGAWTSLPRALPAVFLVATLATVGQLAVLLSLSSVRAVALETFSQCLRMKVAGIFIILLALVLGLLPFGVKGDSTLAGQIRTFLNYSVSATSILLMLVTIFLSVGVISSDVRNKQIFTVATKPISRWQYVVGRWIGVVLLVLLLLALAGGGIYGVAQHLRGRSALGPEDRRTVETEIFTARRRVSPDPVNIERLVEARIGWLKENNHYASAIESYRSAKNLDTDAAVRELKAQIRKDFSTAMQSAAPPIRTGRQVTFYSLSWNFSGINVAGTEMRATGRIAEVSSAKERLMLIEAPPAVVGRLVYKGPVQVEDIDGRVDDRRKDSFVFKPDDPKGARIASLEANGEVSILIEPTIQITYKPKASSSVPGETLDSEWEIRSPTTGFAARVSRSDPVKLQSTLTLSARVVGQDGKMRVTYINHSPATVSILNRDISVLYRVGGFEWNFIRSLVLAALPLMFMAGVGILAGSFLSFPVGCLVSFAVLPFGLMRGFLAEAVDPGKAASEAGGVFLQVGHGINVLMSVLLPDLSSPAESLVDGMNIGWITVGGGVTLTLVVRTLLVLSAACVIFQKRELAAVQV